VGKIVLRGGKADVSELASDDLSLMGTVSRTTTANRLFDRFDGGEIDRAMFDSQVARVQGARRLLREAPGS
jgi:hypothetical protein